MHACVCACVRSLHGDIPFQLLPTIIMKHFPASYVLTLIQKPIKWDEEHMTAKKAKVLVCMSEHDMKHLANVFLKLNLLCYHPIMDNCCIITVPCNVNMLQTPICTRIHANRGRQLETIP